MMNQPLFSDVVQIGIVVQSAEDTARRYQELFGVTDWHFNEVNTEMGKGANFRSHGEPIEAKALLVWTQLGNVELELIEPRDDDSVYAQFLRERGPGIHHVMFATGDYDTCLDRMQANGIATMASGELQNTRFQLLDTAEALGLICEIADGEVLVPDRSKP
jgi:4-hydroxyphenylpyruvate dioxygenase-like putative hemolysin